MTCVYLMFLTAYLEGRACEQTQFEQSYFNFTPVPHTQWAWSMAKPDPNNVFELTSEQVNSKVWNVQSRILLVTASQA